MTKSAREFPAWLDVSRETRDRLNHLADMVLKWNPAVNLISRTSAGEVWGRHVLDSAQIALLAGAKGDQWADLGSGGGFPGLVLAAMSGELWPQRRFTLVESDGRKSVFLAQAIRELDLPAIVVPSRIEAAAPLAAEIVSARALAPLGELLAFALRHLEPDGRAFFPKGANHRVEIESARHHWRFDVVAHISRTDHASAILEVSGIELL